VALFQIIEILVRVLPLSLEREVYILDLTHPPAFSSLLCIERKIIHSSAEKISRYITLNFKIVALFLIMSRIMLSVKSS
jgi:hypothetical protein